MLSNNNGTMTFNNFSNIPKIPSQVFTYLIKNNYQEFENILFNDLNLINGREWEEHKEQ